MGLVVGSADSFICLELSLLMVQIVGVGHRTMEFSAFNIEFFLQITVIEKQR